MDDFYKDCKTIDEARQIKWEKNRIYSENGTAPNEEKCKSVNSQFDDFQKVCNKGTKHQKKTGYTSQSPLQNFFDFARKYGTLEQQRGNLVVTIDLKPLTDSITDPSLKFIIAGIMSNIKEKK